MIRGGFLDSESRKELTELAWDRSAAHRLTRRANALVLLDDGMILLWDAPRIAALNMGVQPRYEGLIPTLRGRLLAGVGPGTAGRGVIPAWQESPAESRKTLHTIREATRSVRHRTAGKGGAPFDWAELTCRISGPPAYAGARPNMVGRWVMPADRNRRPGVGKFYMLQQCRLKRRGNSL